MRLRRALVLATLLLAGAAARAEIKVEVEGVRGSARANVLAYLSLQRYATLDDLSEDTVQRLFRRADGEVADALRPFGYYEPKVASELVRDGKNWVARLVVTPGPPVLLKDVSIAVDGPGSEESFIREVLDTEVLRPGDQLDHGAYERLKGELQRRATANGYLDARFTKSELLVDPERREAVATIRLETGPRYRFGRTEIEQDALDPQFVRRFLRHVDGDWYSSAALLRTQFALDDTQYFSVVEVLPGDRDPETLTVPVRIVAERNKLNRYTFGVGYETVDGWRLRVRWDRRIVNRRGHRARVEAGYAQRNRQLRANYVIPIGDPALEKVELRLESTFDELGDTEVTTNRFRSGLTQVLGRWQRATFVDLVNTTSTVGDTDTTDRLVVPGVSFAPVPRGFITDPGNQFRGFYGELIGSAPALGSTAKFVRLRLRDDRRWELAPKWYLLARGEAGAAAVDDLGELPIEYRFFAGGDRSVRGFSFNSLSPTEPGPGPDGLLGTADDEELKTGGQYLLVASLEIERDLPKNFAVAVFADAGNAFNSFSDPIEYSVGVGVRYKLPFVSIGIDVAQPLSAPGAGPRLHLNILPVF